MINALAGGPKRDGVLVLDNHDSFVHTIVGYLRALGARVTVLLNDDDAVPDALPRHAGVLVSPGPGSPRTAGQSLAVIDWCARTATPMLGVCLGHQALAEYFGGRVTLASRVMHGRTSLVEHNGSGVFAGLPRPLTVTRYHSLAVEPDSVPDVLEVTALTVPTPQDPARVIMGLQHRELPMTGVQFHPEAVLTEAGYPLLRNWLAEVG
ncbi:gamma-glutamyl-gamma-aminobutyrate hydrolase family protein [Rarobacter faecitabidus]|uniref:Para-aminobenzoate synthetase component 2 n=1 Tax=Rarobacter faecitabidus TaxID=13243 RepID=A0A542ZPD1_RARFA|nr:aminodeoxychorismate/anthranilate synthase component II [Rarobacter faecitabidus]TQL62177.1 para-aminobenzoate synthetase component 2 [Rarobacter faecitabidus]